MPSNTPYATVVDTSNASQLALRILGVADKNLQQKAKDKLRAVKDSY